MQRNYDLYQQIIKNPNEPKPIDLVVITAISNDQKRCYEVQIERKLSLNQLPAQIPFNVRKIHIQSLFNLFKLFTLYLVISILKLIHYKDYFRP